MKKIKEVVDRIMEVALTILVSLMVLNVLWQVFTRFVVGNPSSFTEELARYLLIWVGILGAGYVTGLKMHLAIDYFQKKISAKKRTFLEVTIHFVVALFALSVMVVGGINLVAMTLYLEQVSASLQIQLGYVYLAVPLGGMLIMFYSFYHIYELSISKKTIK